MARLLPDATLHIYDDGHLGLLTQAHELAPLITDFLLNPRPEHTARTTMRPRPIRTCLSSARSTRT